MQALTNFRLVPGFSSRFFFLENILTGLWPALKGLASEGLHLYCWKLLSNAVLKFGLLESSEKKVDSSRDFTAKGTSSRRSLVALWWRRLARRRESHMWGLRVPSNLRLEEKNFHRLSLWQFGVLKKRSNQKTKKASPQLFFSKMPPRKIRESRPSDFKSRQVGPKASENEVWPTVRCARVSGFQRTSN